MAKVFYYIGVMEEDWFHAILLYLYEKPFDGTPHNIKESASKINGFNIADNAHLNKLANVVSVLVEKNYIKKTETLNLMLTIEGYNYMLQRKRDKRQDRLYWIPIAISFAAIIIAWLNYLN